MPSVKPPLPASVKGRCRTFRKQPTEAEQRMWRFLRDRNLVGLKFRRQHPVGSYVLDFYCQEASLAVEIDGGGHLEPEQAEYDEKRTVDLNQRGIQLLRFRNDEVLVQTDAVLEEIMETATNTLAQKT